MATAVQTEHPTRHSFEIAFKYFQKNDIPYTDILQDKKANDYLEQHKHTQ